LKGFSLFDWDLFLKTSLTKALPLLRAEKSFLLSLGFKPLGKVSGLFVIYFASYLLGPSLLKKRK
jgi:hypothetical protein